MARRAHAYPQVSLDAAELIDAAVVAAPAGISAADALRLARRRSAGILACGDAIVLREDLARADALGLGEMAAAALARPLPVVGAREPEVAVRRRLGSGAPAVVVRERGTVTGAVTRTPPPHAPSMQGRLDGSLAPPARERLAAAGRIAPALGARAFVVGGLVRDAWLGRGPRGHDVDVVVEGDGLAVARALAAELGGTLIEHERFLTASVTMRDAEGVARIDVVTARSERYEAPGALPRVLPATIAQDLRRRDFTVNAMAVELGGRDTLLDPLGGVADLERRRLRVLHPLSFVEDPTRMLRGARYGARLGLRPDAWTARCQALALGLAPYPALSGHRLAAELERVVSDAQPVEALRRLGRAGVFRLLDPRFRFTRATERRMAALPAALAWATGEAPGAVSALDVTALALAGDQPRPVAEAWLRRLAFTGDRLTRLLAALERGPSALAVLGSATTASATARVLREAGPVTLAWLLLTGDTAVQRRVTAYTRRDGDRVPGLGGEAVIALGVPKGPLVAEVLAALRDARLDGKMTDRAAEMDYVRRWIHSRMGG